MGEERALPTSDSVAADPATSASSTAASTPSAASQTSTPTSIMPLAATPLVPLQASGDSVCERCGEHFAESAKGRSFVAKVRHWEARHARVRKQK